MKMPYNLAIAIKDIRQIAMKQDEMGGNASYHTVPFLCLKTLPKRSVSTSFAVCPLTRQLGVFKTKTESKNIKRKHKTKTQSENTKRKHKAKTQNENTKRKHKTKTLEKLMDFCCIKKSQP